MNFIIKKKKKSDIRHLICFHTIIIQLLFSKTKRLSMKKKHLTTENLIFKKNKFDTKNEAISISNIIIDSQ